jgi:hypothetical protein
MFYMWSVPREYKRSRVIVGRNVTSHLRWHFWSVLINGRLCQIFISFFQQIRHSKYISVCEWRNLCRMNV